VDDYNSKWYDAQGFGKLPVLEIRIFPKVRRVVQSQMTSKANSSKIFWIRISSIHISMVYEESNDFPFSRVIFCSFPAQFTKFFSKFCIHCSSIFVPRIFYSTHFSLQRFFNTFYSFFRKHLTVIGTVFFHAPTIYFITWRNKWSLTVQTLKNEIHTTLRSSWSCTKPLPNEITHDDIIYGMHEGVNI